MRIVVIGHGPSPQGMGWGPKIDEADIVVRMFNCAWQDAADYGTKYDVGLITADARSIDWLYREPVRRPKAWWIYSPGGTEYRFRGKVPQELVVLADEQRQGRGIGVTQNRFAFTRGAAAALYALSNRPDEVVLVGLDEVVGQSFSETPYPQACFDDMAKNPALNMSAPRQVNTSVSDYHDLRAEMAAIRWSAAVCEVKVLTGEEAFA